MLTAMRTAMLFAHHACRSLWNFAHAEDDRPVQPLPTRKTLGAEVCIA
jgi:hypothetical protein